MPSKLQELKQEIQRLRPEILIDEISHQFGDEHHCDCEVEMIFRPITLEDVLSVLDKLWPEPYQEIKIENGKYYFDNNLSGDIYWLLGKPLDDQSEETISFLYKLIK